MGSLIWSVAAETIDTFMALLEFCTSLYDVTKTTEKTTLTAANVLHSTVQASSLAICCIELTLTTSADVVLVPLASTVTTE